ncbi:hypothetical protein JZM24_09160 [Candidatus Sodalis endolongispinus]|uniref:Uncharacterized protein n=1 Tax=Candidatus Sodalis endolongispinus TaxID=2812662 RepID=A0ABS5YBB3_9GAMM|nr:hypothetical protein [Candidatus Sodalis endolongispinus]MBT9432252.1 hypothetical protein [Candidatus Sodalis endolongispinus]
MFRREREKYKKLKGVEKNISTEKLPKIIFFPQEIKIKNITINIDPIDPLFSKGNSEIDYRDNIIKNIATALKTIDNHRETRAQENIKGEKEDIRRKIIETFKEDKTINVNKEEIIKEIEENPIS